MLRQLLLWLLEVNNQMIEPPGAARVPAEDKPVIDQPALEINKGDHVEDDQPQDDYEVSFQLVKSLTKSYEILYFLDFFYFHTILENKVFTLI